MLRRTNNSAALSRDAATDSGSRRPIALIQVYLDGVRLAETPGARDRIVVVPAAMPFVVRRIHHIRAEGTFGVTIAKLNGAAAAMAVGWPFGFGRGVNIAV